MGRRWLKSGVDGEGPTKGCGCTGGAHDEHEAHGLDAGRVEAQRLVERRRLLPSRKEKAYDAGRGAGQEMGGRGAAVAQAACTRGGFDSKVVGARARAERT